MKNVSYKISDMSVITRQYQNIKMMVIIPGPYLILMYNMKKFLLAVTEELHRVDGQTDKNTDAQDRF